MKNEFDQDIILNYEARPMDCFWARIYNYKSHIMFAGLGLFLAFLIFLETQRLPDPKNINDFLTFAPVAILLLGSFTIYPLFSVGYFFLTPKPRRSGTLRISKASVSAKDLAGNEISTPFTEFSRVIKGKQGFRFIRRQAEDFYLPRRVFEAQDLANFETLLNEKGL